MNETYILNGADCKVIINGVDIGNYRCYKEETSIEEVSILAQGTSDIETENIKVVIKDINNSITQNDKVDVIIHKRSNEKYYKTEIFDCKLEKCREPYNDYSFMVSGLQVVTITKEEYETLNESKIDWYKIKLEAGKRKDDIFEELCYDIIKKIKLPIEGTFHCNAADGGRDFEWEWPWVECEHNCIKMPYFKIIMQCKYSESCKNITQKEIWEELTKCVRYFPDDYILVTNREMTKEVQDWWKDISNGLFRNPNTKYYIPFRLHLINRYDLEGLVNRYYDIKKKYF